MEHRLAARVASLLAAVVDWRDRKCARARLESERLAAVQRQAAPGLPHELLGVTGHELRGSLTTILGFSEVLLEDDGELTDAQRLRFLTRIAAQARRLERLTTGVLDASAPAEPAHTHLGRSLGVLVADVAGSVECHRIQVGRVAPGLCVAAPYRALRLLLGSLLDAALELAEDGGAVVLEAERAPAAREGAPERAALTCTLKCAPAVAADPGRLLQSLVRTAPAGAGGLAVGLHLVAQVAAGHGGQVTVDGSGRTVRFTVSVPAADPQPGVAAPTAGVPAGAPA